MATILSSERDFVWDQKAKSNILAGSWAAYLVPLGRLLFSLIFIMSGFRHFSAPLVEYAASQGVPWANVLVPLSGIIAILGGISVLLGYKIQFGALLLIAFLVPVTLMMHNFWTFADPMMRQGQMAHFMKNLTMIGGALLIFYFGAGPYSLDSRMLLRGRESQSK